MASNNFYNYRLYRTTPKLSGNMKWDIILDNPRANGDVFVRDFHLRPISPLIPYNVDMSTDLLTRPHQFNIAEFYKNTKGSFFKYPIDTHLASDWPWILDENDLGYSGENIKYIKNWDDTYLSGTQRMSYGLYETTHECLIPMWLEQCHGVKVKFKMKTKDGYSVRTFTLDLTRQSYENAPIYHKRFVEYFINYLKYTNIYKGCYDCLSIEFDKKNATIHGIDVRSGSVITRVDNSLVRNLVFRERPLMEQNSLITNMYPNTEMIIPNLINFNFCFDFFSSINMVDRELFGKTPSFKIDPEVSFCTTYNNIDKTYYWTSEKKNFSGRADYHKSTVRDIFVNHEMVKDVYLDVDGKRKFRNVLDYMQDYAVTDLMHKNKIVSPICHWMVVDSGLNLFNTYKGSFDPDSIIDSDSHDWTGIKYGGELDLIKVLANPYKYIDEGYLQNAGSYLNGIKAGFEGDEDTENLYIGLMTTPPSTDYYKYQTGINTWIRHPGFLGMIVADWEPNEDGMVDPKIRSVVDDTLKIEEITTDTQRTSATSAAFYICMVRFGEDENGEKVVGKGKNLAVVFFTPSMLTVANGRTFRDAPPNILPENYNYSGGRFTMLSINSIAKVIDKYMAAYVDDTGDELKHVDDPSRDQLVRDLKYIDNLHGLFGKIIRSNTRQMIFFDNRVLPMQDNTLSPESIELSLYKTPNENTHIKRYPSRIVPLMMPCPCFMEEDEEDPDRFAEFENYFYTKDMILSNNFDRSIVREFSKEASDLLDRIPKINKADNYIRYFDTGISPTYPSLDYDCIQSKISKNKGMQPEVLNYDKEVNHTKESVLDTEYADLKELKWFDHSTICLMPKVINIPVTEMDNNDKKTLDDFAIKYIKNYLGFDSLDLTFIKKLYCLDYYLHETVPVKENGEYQRDPATNQILYKYKYSVKAHLR